MRGRRRIVASLLIMFTVVVAALTARPSAAQTPPSASVSPEAALLSLLPYRLQQVDVPSGYHLETTGATTPDNIAFIVGDTDEDSQAALQELQQQGYLVSFTQELVPNENVPARRFVFSAALFDSATDASNWLHDDLDVTPTSIEAVDNPPLSIRLGDESGAVHEVFTRPNSDNEQREIIYWRHSSVLLSARLSTVDSTESLDQVIPIALIADKRAASVAAPAPSAQATPPAAGDESYRVDALYALYPRLPGVAQRPLGLDSVGNDVINNADIILYASDPMGIYTRMAQSWKRVTGMVHLYDTLQLEDGELLNVTYSLSADTQGARAMMLDPEAIRYSLADIEHAPPASAFTVYSLPQPLGDDGRMFHATYTSDMGVSLDVWAAAWLEGKVVLVAADTAPSGTVSAQDVAGHAATIDARYNRGALPSTLTAPLPTEPRIQPAPSPTPIVSQ